jgi:hypothetical protein
MLRAFKFGLRQSICRLQVMPKWLSLRPNGQLGTGGRVHEDCAAGDRWACDLLDSLGHRNPRSDHRMRAVIWKTVSVANVTWIERGGAAAMQQQQLVQLHDLIELDPHVIDRGSHPLCPLGSRREFRRDFEKSVSAMQRRLLRRLCWWNRSPFKPLRTQQRRNGRQRLRGRSSARSPPGRAPVPGET